MVLLVLAMVGSVLAGILVYLVPAVQGRDKDPFVGVPSPKISSFRFAQLTGQDLGGIDLSQVTDPWTLTFDSATKWPEAGRMPEGFSPSELMEETKYLGLGLGDLHDRGVTGKGVCVAVIDTPMLQGHRDFPAGLEYIEMMPGDPGMDRVNFHGSAVSGILAGKNGVAPSARLYFFAVPYDDKPYARYAEAMEKLLALDQDLPPEEKVRVVVVPRGADPFDVVDGVTGASAWGEAIEKAQATGMAVVYPGMEGLQFAGAGAPPDKDRDDPASYRAWTWTSTKAEVVAKIRDSGAGSWEAARKELIRLLTEDPDLDSLRAEAINTYIYLMESYKRIMDFDEWLSMVSSDQPGTLAFPVDFITLPNSESSESYTYYGSGGLSWAASYAAGILALGFQVKPEATPYELYIYLMDTGTPFVAGGKLVNPSGFLEALK